jgi:hypothetical protein
MDLPVISLLPKFFPCSGRTSPRSLSLDGFVARLVRLLASSLGRFTPHGRDPSPSPSLSLDGFPPRRLRLHRDTPRLVVAGLLLWRDAKWCRVELRSRVRELEHEISLATTIIQADLDGQL